MTEFDRKFISEQKKLAEGISSLPWVACSCGKCGMIDNEIDLIATATHGKWGDDYPSLKRVGGSIGGKFELIMDQITYGEVSLEVGNANAKWIAAACSNYSAALDALEDLTAERDYLDERLAEFENMAREFVSYAAPDHIIRWHFEFMLKEKETK